MYEIVAAYKLLNGKDLRISPELLRKARKVVLDLDKDPKAGPAHESLVDMMALLWMFYRIEAETGVFEEYEFFEANEEWYIQPEHSLYKAFQQKPFQG